MARVMSVIFILVIAFVENLAIELYLPPLPKMEPLALEPIKLFVEDNEGTRRDDFHEKYDGVFVGTEANTTSQMNFHTRNSQCPFGTDTTNTPVNCTPHGSDYIVVYQEYQLTASNNTDGTKVKMTSNLVSRNKACVYTETKIVDLQTGGLKDVCAGQLLLYDQFDTLNQSLWRQVEEFAGPPDYAFVAYRNDERNVKCVNGNLHITPTLMESEYNRDFVRQGNLALPRCTGQWGTVTCQRQARGAYILPPVLSGRIDTKTNFAFIYGKVEIRAKLPRGDWIYAILDLEPLESAPRGSSPSFHPQLKVAASTGNNVLQGPSGIDLSGHALFGGPGEINPIRTRPNSLSKRYLNNMWFDDYHVYELEWRRDKIVSRVDGIEYGSTPTLVPFDRPFFPSLGLTVGGHTEFPDLSRTDTHEKPWQNMGSKALFDFFNATDLWSRTWIEYSKDLKVDYIKVWAL